MHFWIDKRSQQCGFGRSRVAASLSHAGGGLSYGHPPRRSKSSSNTNSSNSHMASSSSNNSGSHSQALASVHRNLASYGGGLDCQIGAGTSRQASHYSSSSSNNNAQHPLQQQLFHHSSNNNNSNAAAVAAAAMTTATTASNNNNASATASSAAVLTGSGTIVPLVAHGSHGYHQHGTRYQPRTQHQQQQQLQQQQHQQQQQHHYSYSYHHPQFGNMAVPVRHYEQHHQQQQQQHHQPHQQHSGVYADDAYSAYHHHHSSSSNSCNNTNNSRYATPRRHNSSSNMRHATAAAATATSATAAAVSISATPIPPTQTPATSQGSQLQQQHHALLQHADSQLLPSHLKCGMCASLVLASVFVAGAKFYFDHQGTGLEVLIFCAFSATFFLAACMVSLCRIPKGLLPSRSDGRAVCHSRGVNAGGGNVSSCMLELNDVRYLDERQVEVSAETAAAAAAGPPPYHIAILLPEQTPTALGKQLPLDESPPPSYDKILV